jgi:hypothetical protein
MCSLCSFVAIGLVYLRASVFILVPLDRADRRTEAAPMPPLAAQKAQTTKYVV